MEVIVEGIVTVLKEMALKNMYSPKTVRPFVKMIWVRALHRENEEGPKDYKCIKYYHYKKNQKNYNDNNHYRVLIEESIEI